jgi:aspartate/methionine/tyrosine aminotransferase
MSLKGDRAIFGKSTDPSMLDLRLGNPYFIIEYWREVAALGRTLGGTNTFVEQMPYQLEVTDPLKSELEKLNKKFNKGSGHIVIGNGATQLIGAAMYALKTVEEKKSCTFPIPHYPRFTILSKMENLEVGDKGIKILTIPNNPDGDMFKTHKSTDILDACYAWPHYGFKGKEIDAKVKIYSFAKFAGFASTRFGWAIVKDQEVAELMNLHIEMITSGVAIHTQNFVTDFLKSQETEKYTFIKDTGDALKRRWVGIKALEKKSKGKFKILNKTEGMFLYAKIEPKLFEKLKVLAVPAAAFGDHKSKNVWRINLGCSFAQFQTLLVRLNQNVK